MTHQLTWALAAIIVRAWCPDQATQTVLRLFKAFRAFVTGTAVVGVDGATHHNALASSSGALPFPRPLLTVGLGILGFRRPAEGPPPK